VHPERSQPTENLSFGAMSRCGVDKKEIWSSTSAGLFPVKGGEKKKKTGVIRKPEPKERDFQWGEKEKKKNPQNKKQNPKKKNKGREKRKNRSWVIRA